MKRGKQFPQKVLWVQESERLTSRGNPTAYWYLLGCGHVEMNFHSMKSVLDEFMALKGLYFERNCRKCRYTNVPDDERSERYPLGMVRAVFGSAGQRMLEIHRESGLLIDRLPIEAVQGFNKTDKVYRHLYQTIVVEHHSGDLLHDPETPFKEKYVYRWWELENGYAVGWNENPSRGWSFPVKRLKKV